MPADASFSFRVTVGGQPVPEYSKDGLAYVESNLWTPVSYRQSVRELVYGEIEEQEWPVTPYKVEVEAAKSCPLSWFLLYVDGVLAGRRVLKSQQKHVFEGFPTEKGVREFLFALPRFARDEDDRVNAERKCKVGSIEIVRELAEFLYTRETLHDGLIVDYSQANKKDSRDITQGEFTMPTTKEGRLVRDRKPHLHTVNYYGHGPEQGRLSVLYRMGHTLQEMGIVLSSSGST